MQIRINKFLSTCNIGSRRTIEQLLKNKEFRVNGKIAEPGQLIETTDIVTHHGVTVVPQENFIYIALNKPIGVVSTAKDEHHRTTVLDLVPNGSRLYPVGRLDMDSTGLILLTNNGDLALKLTHPKYHLPKTYEVTTFETITPEFIKKMEEGVQLDAETTTLPAKVEQLDLNKFRITLYQGMKRQIREMCSQIGFKVNTLHRISIGNLKLGSLKSGKYRYLNEVEIKNLLNFSKTSQN